MIRSITFATTLLCAAAAQAATPDARFISLKTDLDLRESGVGIDIPDPRQIGTCTRKLDGSLDTDGMHDRWQGFLDRKSVAAVVRAIAEPNGDDCAVPFSLD